MSTTNTVGGPIAGDKAKNHKKLRVLVIDDDEDEFRIVELLLRRAPGITFDVEWSESYEEGLALVHKAEHDVYLVDHNLGAQTGLDLLAVANKTGLKRPIIMLTGMGDEHTGLEAIRLGAADYLVKGVGGGALLARAIRYAIERKRTEEWLAFLARHDAMTGLANRDLFYTRLGEAIHRARRHRKQVGLMYVDIDDFKPINDTHGHEVGDKVIIGVAARLSAAVREVDTVARMGGDEFAIVLDDIEGSDGAVIVAERVLDGLVEPIDCEAVSVTAAPSIGIALFPEHTGEGEGEDLVTLADQAMYQAKRRSGGSYVVYQPGDAAQDATTASVPLVGVTSVLIEPQMDVRTGDTLLVAHTTAQLSRHEPCVQALRLIASQLPAGHGGPQPGLPTVWLRLQGSGVRPGLPRTLREAIPAAGLRPDNVTLALPQSFVLEMSASRAQLLGKIVSLGVRLAISEFAGEFNRLFALSDLPRIDTIELDGAMVQQMTRGTLHETLVHATIETILRLGSKPAAAGVTTETQVELLRAAGCTIIRGPHVGPPAEFTNQPASNGAVPAANDAA